MFPPVSATKQARLILGMAFLLNLLGTCGVMWGVTDMGATPASPSMITAEGDGPSLEQLTAEEREAELRATSAALRDAMEPYRRPFAAANVIVSLMLVVGSLMLVRRRPSSLWWIRQAIAANVLWVIAQASGVVVTLHRHAAEILPLAETLLEIQMVSLGIPEEARAAGAPVITTFVVATVLWAGVKVLAFLAVGWGAHRPAVRDFVAGR